eukprot:CAMPEP_0118658690 /NCGR_PEP_ID=MMETSP0785-20121206/14707_1 /TAXON_ID=91992 /ORGANISM="Bolidomonas pacifica, Strain CCMP 1866" /LENGTH=1758 /DNA_ID=CAMNT_0006551733 /DNA_START=48 /DNA_END=5320 /DNA_ORIENTATION=-
MTSYTPSQLLAPRADHELPRSISSLYTVSGMDVGKRQNLVQIDEKTLIYSAGNTLVTFNMETKKRKFLLGLDGGAIGAFTFSPDRSVIAVACNGMKPCIYIYSFPSMIVTKVLKLGTERGYSSLDFSPDGTLLSSVGQNPDFLLTVWDWKEERITLHTKAFGQDVYKVAFSKEENAGRLTTSGTGHIRFWNMAKTFTGLKLQGEIGKFGKIDLSDIEAFVELPDSKVVSGSESGHLLLWEGNFVKCRLVTSKESPELMYKKAGEDLIFGDVPAHAGGVCSITHDRELDMIITAGVDGNIKFWSFAEIDVAEVDSDITMDYPIMPSKTIPLGAGVSIKHIVDSGDSYLVEDANGALFRQSKTATSPDDKETLWIFHSGPIVGVVTSSVEHYCATAGSDGQVFIWDYITKTVVASNKSNHGCTSITAPPTTLDETGRTYTVGFEDGVMRCFTFSDDALTLKQVIKPHNGPITAISYSPDGKYVATGGHDGICFVIKCPDPIDSAGAYTPIGFVTSEDEAPITALSWKEDSKALMYSYANTMVEMDVSDGISAISANSFEMEPKTTVYHYKDRPVIKDASEEDGLEEKKGDEQSEDHVEITPPPICHACYKVGEDKDNFLVGLGAEKAGKIFEGKFGDEYSLGEYHSGVAIHNVEIDDVAKVTKISYSSSKKFIIITCDDGSVTVRPNSELGFFTKYSIHDSSSGGSSGAAISFDDEFLLTTGFDGLLVTHRLNPEGVTEAAVKAKAGEKINETLPDSIFNFEDSGEGSSVPPEGFKEVFSSSKEGQEKAANAAAAAAVEDITDDAAYSIQDEKLRKEEDARKLAAEKKKDGVREVIANMQKEYSDLVKKNSNLPIELQLTEEELRVDPEYDQILAEQGRQMIEEVQLECAHESEKSSIRLGKLQKEYIEVLECEPFCVHGMKNGLAVPSFPTRKLSPELQDLLDIVHSVMEGEGGGSTRGKMYSEGSGRSRRSHRASRVTKQRINITDLGLDEDGNEKKLTRPERRKMMRLERQHALDELIEKKPSDDADDPRDVKAIEFAKKNLGDYKIKTSEGYEVPEEQQVNADKKMRQLVLLIESIHNIKVKFNKRLTATRDAKCDTYQSVKAFNERIKNIDKQLGQPELSDKLWLPELMSSEYPEDRSFFTQTDVDAFLKSAEGADGDVSKAVCPMTALPSKTLQVMEKDTKANAELWDKEALKLARSLPILCATFDSETFGEMPVYEEGATLSQMEEDELSEISKKLTFQRATLVDKIEADVKAVDDQISMLRKDRLVFAGELKAAELRMILLSKELKLLQDFEAKDKMLTSKLEKCQRDKAEVVASISDCHGRLETKSGDLEEWVAKEHEIMEEFKKIVPESNGFYEQLLKIFKRKIKRKKVKNNDDDDDEMDSEEESDDDYDSDSDDDDDEEEVDDSCPPGCDISLYETIIALREKRLDQEETLNEFQKELDELKKAHDRHIGRERQIDKDLKSTEVEILRFQTEKQKELNELLVTVPLKIGQIKLWKKETDSEGNDIEVPENPKILRESIKIDEGAIFSETTLEKLKSRIGELKDEIVVDKSNFGGLHKEKKALEKDKLSREKEISKKEKECEEIQMLKFGQIIDIGELDKISVNNDEAELKNKSKTLEVSNEKEVFSMHAKHRKLKEKLMNLTNINTDKLNGIAGLNARQFFLEKELNGKGGGMQVADDGPTVRQETEERNRLVALVKLQAKEVDALKAEINLLRRKGGHIYAPPPPPELIGGDDVMAMDAPEGSIEGEV